MITQVAPYVLTGLLAELPNPATVASGYQFYATDSKTLFILKIDPATQAHSWEGLSAGPIAKVHLNFVASFPLVGPPIVYSYSVVNSVGIVSAGPIIETATYIAADLTLATSISHFNRCGLLSLHLDPALIPPGGELLDPFLPVGIDTQVDGTALQPGIALNGKGQAPGSPAVEIGMTYALFTIP